ncbi:MAG: hypothetical protein LBQ20_00510 [Rhodanobacter sp.]|jgi:hypothetical protein|nr:hypothetical protein [Rhodanobacter sp.]
MSFWKHSIDLNPVNALSEGCLVQRPGIRITRISDGHLRRTLTVVLGAT